MVVMQGLSGLAWEVWFKGRTFGSGGEEFSPWGSSGLILMAQRTGHVGGLVRGRKAAGLEAREGGIGVVCPCFLNLDGSKLGQNDFEGFYVIILGIGILTIFIFVV